MVQQNSRANDTIDLDVLRTILKSQFHAGLAMLRGAIDRCPDDLWVSKDYTNPFWRVVYHALYYVDLYMQPEAAAFRPWEHHQTMIQDLDDYPAPPEIQELTELPHRPPQTGEPYTKAQMLEYWEICDRMINDAVDRLDLNNPESGFSWYKVPTIEHKIVAIRHVQHHMAQLSERLRTVIDVGVDWVGARRGV